MIPEKKQSPNHHRNSSRSRSRGSHSYEYDSDYDPNRKRGRDRKKSIYKSKSKKNSSTSRSKSREKSQLPPPSSPRSQKRSQKKKKILPFSCNYCFHKFVDYFQLLSHERQHHIFNIRPFGCRSCGRRFPLKTQLEKHRIIHRFRIILLGLRDPDRNSNSHSREFQVIKRALSSGGTISNGSISFDSGTGNEILNSSDGFVCEVCHESFKSQHILRSHQRSHGEQDFKLCRFCPKVFSRTGDRNTHEKRMHLNIKPHRCPDCGNRYTLKSTLSNHRKYNCHPEKKGQKALSGNETEKTPSVPEPRYNYKARSCRYCHKVFPYASQAQYHALNCKAKIPVKCSSCSKEFESTRSLKRHVRRSNRCSWLREIRGKLSNANRNQCQDQIHAAKNNSATKSSSGIQNTDPASVKRNNASSSKSVSASMTNSSYKIPRLSYQTAAPASVKRVDASSSNSAPTSKTKLVNGIPRSSAPNNALVLVNRIDAPSGSGSTSILKSYKIPRLSSQSTASASGKGVDASKPFNGIPSAPTPSTSTSTTAFASDEIIAASNFSKSTSVSIPTNNIISTMSKNLNSTNVETYVAKVPGSLRKTFEHRVASHASLVGVIQNGVCFYKCAYCDKMFKRAYYGHALEHTWIHTGYKPYRCKKCDQGFIRVRPLDEHELKCTGKGGRSRGKNRKQNENFEKLDDDEDADETVTDAERRAVDWILGM